MRKLSDPAPQTLGQAHAGQSYEAIYDYLSKQAGIVEGTSRFGKNLAFASKATGREFAHFHGRRELDVRVTRAEFRKLHDKLGPVQGLVPRRNSSEWVLIELESSNSDQIIALLKTAMEVAFTRKGK